MAAVWTRRVFAIILLSIQITSCQYQIPDVTVQALKPKGFRASIPDDPKVRLFAFHGNVNQTIRHTDVGKINGDVLQAKDGKWIFEDPNIQLNVGDVVYYSFHITTAGGSGYSKNNLKFNVLYLEDPNGPIPNPVPTAKPTECKPTATKVRGGIACSGQTIFEENFTTLRDDVWQIEQYIPVYSTEYPFVSYQRLSQDPTVSVTGGHLRIAPKLQQNVPGFSDTSIYTGSLNLFSGCTSSAEACMKDAWGANILPPIVSGKITSKGFAFTYGTVYVRAKLPQGDWIYPEILLEPFLKKYGSTHYCSGVIKIASARGNKELSNGITDYSNKVLFGGPIMDYKCHGVLLSIKTENSGRQWGDDFHEYVVRWAPDRITLSVDGQEWARVDPAASGLYGRFPDRCDQLPRSLLGLGTRLAPFDDHFYLTFGVAAGSITEFPDGVLTTGGRPKPWTNPSSKAMLHFWQDMEAWLATWNQPQMLIDYVKVTAFCTGVNGTGGCSREASEAHILPPIITAKVTTKNKFYFKYCRVEISAKVPLGDWLYPLIQLEPRNRIYGIRNFASGILRIATVKGNVEFAKKLYAGPIMCDIETFRSKYLSEKIGHDIWGNRRRFTTILWNGDQIQ